MRAALGLLALDGTTAVLGYAVLWRIGVAGLRIGDVRFLGLSYLIGWALLGSTLSFALIAGSDARASTIFALTAVLIALLAASSRGVVRREDAMPRGHKAAERPLATLVAIVGGIAFVAGSVSALIVAATNQWNPSSDWDGVDFWIPRAASIFYENGLDPSAWGSFHHPEYPPLLPALDAAVFHFTGGVHPSLLPVQQTILGVAFMTGALALLDRFAPRWVSLPTFAALATAPWFWQRIQSAMPDSTVWCLTAAAVLVSTLWLLERRGCWLVLAFIFGVAATLTKFEGAFFVGALVLVVIAGSLVADRRTTSPSLWLLLAPAGIVVWRSWLKHHGLPTVTPDYRPSDLLRPGYLGARTHRLTYGLHSMFHATFVLASQAFGALRSPIGRLQSPFDWLKWGFGGREMIALVVPCLGVLLIAFRRAPRASALTFAWVVLAWLGLATIYWIGRPEIHWYVEVTVRRVVPAITVVFVTLLPLLLGLGLGRRGVRHADP